MEMNKYRTRTCAANALKSDIYNWGSCSKKQKADAQLLLIALNEIVNVRYCADEWDFLCFGTTPNLRAKFIEAQQRERDPAEQVKMLIRLIEKMEDPSFYYANRSTGDHLEYDFYR